MSSAISGAGLVWEEPPQGYFDWLGILQEVTERPLQWARIWSGGKSRAYQIAARLRSSRKKPPGDWEFIARYDPNDKTRGFVYARYMSYNGVSHLERFQEAHDEARSLEQE